MTTKEDITQTVSETLEEFYESEDTVIDLTNPKTFCIAAVFSVIFGIMIGTGYQIIFSSMDCTQLFTTQFITDPINGKITQNKICFPNEFARYKMQIFIVTLIAGVLTGISPSLIKIMHRNITEEE